MYILSFKALILIVVGIISILLSGPISRANRSMAIKFGFKVGSDKASQMATAIVGGVFILIGILLIFGVLK